MAGKGNVLAKPMEPFSVQDAGKNLLKERLHQDGYLLLRSFLDTSTVLKARGFLLEELATWRPEALGMMPRNVGLIQRQDLACSAAVLDVLENSCLYQLMADLLGGEVVTAGYKWLRAVGDQEFTGAHMDRVFVGGAARMLTAWIPLGDVSVEQGSLLVCRGSHRLRAFGGVRAGYGRSAVGGDGTRSGWLTEDGAKVGALVGNPHAVDWRTAGVCAGDVVLLDANVLHMTAANVSGALRLSCDTRWQLAGEPRDPRLRVWRGAREARELREMLLLRQRRVEAD